MNLVTINYYNYYIFVTIVDILILSLLNCQGTLVNELSFIVLSKLGAS